MVSIYGLFVIRPNLYGLHGYLLIFYEVGVFGRFFALKIIYGAGERLLVQKFIYFCVGDGCSISLWFYNGIH